MAMATIEHRLARLEARAQQLDVRAGRGRPLLIILEHAGETLDVACARLGIDPNRLTKPIAPHLVVRPVAGQPNLTY
jgi:hypothetical protein